MLTQLLRTVGTVGTAEFGLRVSADPLPSDVNGDEVERMDR